MESHRRDLEERPEFVRFWAAYVKRTPNEKWSTQQNIIVNSIFTANQDIKLYLKVKRLAKLR